MTTSVLFTGCMKVTVSKKPLGASCLVYSCAFAMRCSAEKLFENAWSERLILTPPSATLVAVPVGPSAAFVAAYVPHIAFEPSHRWVEGFGVPGPLFCGFRVVSFHCALDNATPK